jgi:D-alanyl-D-alanine carboxypeptidase
MKTLPASLLASNAALGITEALMDARGLPLCLEPAELVDTELDCYSRQQRLTPECFAAWTAMKRAALEQGVTIFLISAFRSLEYQHQLIAKKLASGRCIEDILRVNAAPGFSEHHTGRAIDIGTEKCGPLVEEFEKTAAFQWLELNAESYGFQLSYPRNNPFGIAYEPWHWCFKKS